MFYLLTLYYFRLQKHRLRPYTQVIAEVIHQGSRFLFSQRLLLQSAPADLWKDCRLKVCLASVVRLCLILLHSLWSEPHSPTPIHVS